MKLLFILATIILASRGFLAGEDHFCQDGLMHHVTYNVSDTTKPVYDITSLDGFKGLTCDLDGTKLRLEFHTVVESHKYWMKFKLGGAFLSGVSNKTCPMVMDPSKGFLLRSVESAVIELNSEHHLSISTSQAMYDQVYESADISYSSS
jgi:hypothetical protein